VLGGDADEGADPALLREEAEHGSHLDCLRPGAEDGEDGLPGVIG